MPSSSGERLEALMRAAGYTRKSLAAALGVHVNTLSGWITGKYPPRDPQVRAALASAVGEDVFATWVDLGEGREIVQLADIPNDVFADEIIRRLGVTRTRDPFVINDSDAIRNEDPGEDDSSGQGKRA